MHSVKIKKWKFKKKPYIFSDTFFLYHLHYKLSGTKKWNLKKTPIYKIVSICIFDSFWGLVFWCLCMHNLGNRLPNCQCHWHSTQTRLHDRLTDGLASHLLMCCVVVSSPSTPVNMGRCCRVASHLLCLCCPTPALPVRHTAACGCVIDCHVASHLL